MSWQKATLRTVGAVESALYKLFLPKPDLKDVPYEWIDGHFDAHHIRLDSKYKAIDMETLSQVLNLDPVSENLYVSDKYDCDNFAFELFSKLKKWQGRLAIGIIIGTSAEGNRHAWNYVVVHDKGKFKIIFIEPQTDRKFKRTIEEITDVIS